MSKKIILRMVATLFLVCCILISTGIVKLPKYGIGDPRLEGYTGMIADAPGPNESVYSGEMRDGLFEGKGDLVYKDGSRYEGAFKRGYFDGDGTYTSAEGWSFTGTWKNGMPDGDGTYKAADGRTYAGVFEEGSAV